MSEAMGLRGLRASDEKEELQMMADTYIVCSVARLDVQADYIYHYYPA